MPVSPSSAALRNVSRGKWPVSSSWRASGFTSEAAKFADGPLQQFLFFVQVQVHKTPQRRGRIDPKHYAVPLDQR